MEQEKTIDCTNKDFGRFYVVLKLNLKTNGYECIYSHNQEVYEIAKKIQKYYKTEIVIKKDRRLWYVYSDVYREIYSWCW